MRLKSIYLVLIISFFLPAITWAQGGGLPPAPVDTPIDGGLSILIGAGVAYGLKKVRDQRKKNQQEQRDKNI